MTILLLFCLVLLFLLAIIPETLHHQTNICSPIMGEYVCSIIERRALKKLEIDLPSEACVIRNCQHCIKGFKTFVIKNDQLVEPKMFLVTSVNSSDIQIIHIDDEERIINPQMVNFEICLADKRKLRSKSTFQRKLLEAEKAEFSKDNITFTFDDPVISFSDLGKVIIRTPDFEHVYNIPKDLKITLPFEILAFKTILSVIYIHKDGHTVAGDIILSGKTLCQTKQCILCWSVLSHLKCVPIAVRYFAYTLFALIICFVMWCTKSIIKSFVFMVQIIFTFLYAIFKFLKLMARVSLLLGSYIGSSIRNISINLFLFLENHRENIPDISLKQVVISIIFCILTPLKADCNINAIIKSDLRSCSTMSDGSRTCNLFTTAEITLPTLQSEVCLWFSNKEDAHLFTLKIKLEAVTCSYNTKKLYYTFPVKHRHLAQISCIFNRFCGQGVHCIKQKAGTQGLRFEAETQESRNYPGVSGCIGGGHGVGCHILTRSSCNFFRNWFEPDFIHSYEVSQITGQTCKYHLSIQNLENNTVSHITLKDTVYTDQGIKVNILGAFNQPQIFIPEHFVQRVGQRKEAYLVHACEQSNPKVGQVGSVQANESFTNNFVFDPDLSKCDFYEDRLRCIDYPDPILELKSSQKNALPLERDLHLFKIENENLISTLLVSSAVKIQILFQDFKIHTFVNTVCPKFKDNNFVIAGCYKCAILAQIKFSALSTCQSGLVQVQFQTLNVHTKALHLTTTPQEFTIKFLGETKCTTEKICLRSHNIVQCKKIEICLEEPSIELKYLLGNNTSQASAITATNFWDWINLPTFPASFMWIKMVGSIFVILCASITIISTMITCLCRK